MSAGPGSATPAQLRELAEDPRLAELGAYVPPLSLLGAFGIERNEVAHSRALARLLDPSRHRQAGSALGSLLREIAGRPGLEGGTAAALRAAADGPRTRVAVHRERMLIDVVAEISTAEGTVVLAFENKLDAGEQPEQLARYQAALARAYPGNAAVLAFLTPTGRDPTTADWGAPVPVVTLGWDAVLRATGQALDRAPAGGRDERVLSEFYDHVREEVLREARDDDAKALARGLWREHGRALRLAMEHRPGMGDVKDELVGLLRGRFGAEANVFVWPERGAPREIKMDFRSWFERGFPFTFMLLRDPEGRPSVRVLIWRGNLRPHAEALARWAPSANAAAGRPLFDERLSRIAGWDWHKVLSEEDYPEAAALEEDAFDSATARAAFDAVVELVEGLRPYVEAPDEDAPGRAPVAGQPPEKS